MQSSEGIRVRYGHRRTLAAIEAVPVIVMGEDDQDELARLTTQWHENEQRAHLNAADKLAAIEQLSLLGMSPSQSVRRTKAPKQTVEDALTAKASNVAKAALAKYDFLTLDQAAVEADFQDQPETVRALVAAAKLSDGDFAHRAQRARDERAEAEERARLIESLTSTGTTVTGPPDYDERTVQPLSRLAGKKDQPMTPAEHATCPGHAAYVTRSWRGVEAIHVCTDPKAHDHRSLYTSSGSTAKKPMDDAAKADAKPSSPTTSPGRPARLCDALICARCSPAKRPPKGTVA